MGNFSLWLENELRTRDMSQSDLSRASGLSTATIANLLNERRKPGVDACTKIASAFGLSEEMVYRAAGIMKPASKDELSPAKRELLYLAELVDDETAELGLDLLRAAWERKKRQMPANGQRKTT